MVFDTDKRIENKLILSLGGNIGDVKAIFKATLRKIEEEIGEVILKSSLYQTAAWGNENQADFFNQVIIVQTKYNASDSLKKCLEIEKYLGRERTGEKWIARPIDIDILFFNEEIIDLPDLKVPHPFILERNFILAPCSEISPNFIHPIAQKTIETLYKESKDDKQIKKLEDN